MVPSCHGEPHSKQRDATVPPALNWGSYFSRLLAQPNAPIGVELRPEDSVMSSALSRTGVSHWGLQTKGSNYKTTPLFQKMQKDAFFVVRAAN